MSTDNGYRVVCHGDGTGNEVTREDMETAFAHLGVEPWKATINLELHNASVSWRDVRDPKGALVVRGSVQGSRGRRGIELGLDGLYFWDDINIDSHADVRTTGGGEGIDVWINDKSHYGVVRVRNFGSIETKGGGPSHENRRGRGIDIGSEGGDVEAINEIGATVVTRGPGARGVNAGSADGSANAINRGTVTTHGRGFLQGSSVRTSDGVYAWAGGSGVTLAVNDAGGVVETRGAGARGVKATGENDRNTVIATNRGQVTTRGSPYSSRRANGVDAWSEYGSTRAANEAGASIRTYGTAAEGLASSGHYRAEAENRGQITTSGQPDDTGRRAHGMRASSKFDSAEAVNHEGATVTTFGRGARGVQADTGYTVHGSPNATAFALNHGKVTTSGDSFWDGNFLQSAGGVSAFSGSAASAVVVNAYTGVVETRGTGAKGVRASAYGAGGGPALARNRGHITTHGEITPINLSNNGRWSSPIGLHAYSVGSDATAMNEVGGVVETHGAVASGVRAESYSGTATAVNGGRVTTYGEAIADLPGYTGRKLGSLGVIAYSEHGNARVENGFTGRVDTHGERGFALISETDGDGSRTSALAEVINRGQAQTRGRNADGVVAVASQDGTAENPNHVQALNTSGASITTAGDGASGLGAYIRLPEGGDGYGSAFVRNDGTVITGYTDDSDITLAVPEHIMPAGGDAANGVAASFYTTGVTPIATAGDVTVVNTGEVTAHDANASALYAQTFGAGTATVHAIGGRVLATHESGRGRWERTGGGVRIVVAIVDGANVAAPGTAVGLDGATTHLRLLDSVLAGAVVFEYVCGQGDPRTACADALEAGGRDTFTIRDARVTGGIDFGAGGYDTLNVHGNAWLEGDIRGVDTLYKRRPGTVVMRGDAQFSPGGHAALEGGGLTFTGHFNLGKTGTMHIHDAARLSAVLENPSEPPRITAGGGITFDGDEELFVQAASTVDTRSVQTWLGGFTSAALAPIADGTPIQGRTGQVALRTAYGPSTVVEVGHIPLSEGKTQVAGTMVDITMSLGVTDLDAPANLSELTFASQTLAEDSAAALSVPGVSGLVLGGSATGLGASLFTVFDAEALTFARDETHGASRLPMPAFTEVRAREGGLEYWTRAWTGDAPVLAGGAEATVRAAALGVDLPLSGGFRVGASTAPALEVSSTSFGTAADARLDGGRYALRGGWHGKVFHASASLSQGRYRAHSVVDNPVTGGELGSEFDFAQDHIHFNAGAQLGWGAVRLMPSLSVHTGVLHQGAHTAEGAVFRAEVPAFSQRYRGWQHALDLSPTQWLRGPGTVRWRPALHLYTQRTHTTGPASLEVVQHDKAGVTSVTSRARVAGLPRTVHGFGASVDALGSEEWRVQFAVTGMQADGEQDRMVHARLHLRF